MPSEIGLVSFREVSGRKEGQGHPRSSLPLRPEGRVAEGQGFAHASPRRSPGRTRRFVANMGAKAKGWEVSHRISTQPRGCDAVVH